jgi:hypothetical protein
MAIFVAFINSSNSFETTLPAMATAMASTMMQLCLLYVRLGARSTSVRARLDPTEGSPALLTFPCWILSERQSLLMCNKLIQQIRYLISLMHFAVHLKIPRELKVIELTTIECSTTPSIVDVLIRSKLIIRYSTYFSRVKIHGVQKFHSSLRPSNILGAEHFIHILPECACHHPPVHQIAFDRLFPRNSHPPPLTSCSRCSKPRSKPCALWNLIRPITCCKSCSYKKQIMHTQPLILIQLRKLLECIQRRPTGIKTKWIVQKPSIA